MKIGSIVIHCYDFDRTVAFWQAALHYVPREPAKDGWAVLRDPRGQGPNLSFQGRDRRPRSRSWLHLDLYTADQQAEVERLVALGARRYPWRYRAGDDFIVLEDPEAPSSASSRRPTCRVIRATTDTSGRRPAMARDRVGFVLDRGKPSRRSKVGCGATPAG